MLILPAIDIKDGKCVRLYQGDYATAREVAADYLETALGFAADGATQIHLVDLDGAKAGRPVNGEIFVRIAQKTPLSAEVGGGIRTVESVRFYLENGIDRVILGSAALRDADFVREALRLYGEKIVIGIDARNGFVSAEGWTQDSSVNYLEFARQMCETGVNSFVFTDISKDGTLEGVNLTQTFALNDAVRQYNATVTASGGVRNLDDLRALKDGGIYGVICGKSLYEGTLNLKEAVELGRQTPHPHWGADFTTQ